MAMTISGIVNSGINYSAFLTGASTHQNATQKSIANLWESYNSSQKSATSTAANVQEVRINAAELVASYDGVKNTFYNEFDENMDNLKESAQAIRKFDFKAVTADTKVFSAASKVVEAATEAANKSTAAEEQGTTTATEDAASKEAFSAAAKVIEASNNNSNEKPNVVQSEFGTTVLTSEESGRVVNSDGSVTTINADGSKVTSIGNGAIQKTETYDRKGNKHIETAYSKVMQSALKTVQDFVDNYNGSLEFFKENSEVSNRISKMAEIFGDAVYNEEVGINVGSDGSLSMDTEKVAQSIVKNAEKVTRVLGGSNGLAAKAERKVDVANSQRSQLFPSAQDVFGKELSEASFYTSRAYLNINAQTNLGNLVNLML